MDVSKIPSASLVDIIFEGRNKSYGAYELRTKYTRRLTIALVITASLALLIILISLLGAKLEGPKKAVVIEAKDVELMNVQEEKPIEPPPPPPPKPPDPPKIEMAKFTPPKVVKDEEVQPEEEMREIEDLKEATISTINQEGVKDLGIVAPPVEDKGGVVAAPVVDDEDKVFQKVEIEAKFPGGDKAWARYIQREITRYIDELQDDGRAGTCVVQFIVDREGNISEVEALTMKGSKLAEICVNAIKRGPKWTPAEQNGRKVKAYRKQPVTFQIADE
ncbi:energy transducer TonB [Agriterribacter sp.]|uniref:energy transducer TonB n=1 Tax=Agriterribacter sp. TaxID=2821509 RepID=UPI002BE9D5B4|nr:energy transducer TonB [Agriterribacter sp.]HRP55242.1 energy transducer TonB [Agriterribacter sp.]